MPTANKPFTDKQKAEIFVRDRATCCFSGANLWLLDAPLRHGWESDWADHVKPLSRGGKSEPYKNGVCASATFNVKKRNNSADTTYLFRNGHPSPLYYELYGLPSVATIERLQRLASLRFPDWYFNRAINWILQAFDYKCWKKNYQTLPSRDDKYWFRAAYEKLLVFQASENSFGSLEERGIIQSPSELQQVLLSLRGSKTLGSFTRRALDIYPAFKINSEAWYEYFHPEDYVDSSEEYDIHRKKSYRKYTSIQKKLNQDTCHCIEFDYQIRYRGH